MKPLNDWMIVEAIDEDEVSKGGIVLTEKKKSVIRKARVLSISDDISRSLRKEEKDLQFEAGDVVVYHAQVGIPVDADDKDNKQLFMKYESVMGVVK